MIDRQVRENHAIRVFSTCPASSGIDRDQLLKRVTEIARWSDDAGCEGILIYTDNGLVDPWLVSQIVIQNTRQLCPLVAVQPVYMHPYSVAKMVTSLAHFYDRRIYLNMVAGGFKNDLNTLNDPTPHDQRYDRLVEYTQVIQRLLRGEAVTYEGAFYQVRQLRLTPPLPSELFPGFLISGSSEAGMAAARAIAATAVKYPKPVAEYESEPLEAGVDCGVRVGIIARAATEIAWTIAHERFPTDRKGQLAHQLATKVSDSVWHKQLAELGDRESSPDNPYWLVPFQNYKTFCPYLVGSYDTVAAEVARYVAVGHQTFILDVPDSPEELGHIREVFARALEYTRASV